MTSDPTPIDDEGALRSLYRPAHQAVLDKHIDHIDAGAASFLAATTLIVVATHGPNGADASPRGGPPGFVHVLGPDRIAFADLAGNNRLDTYANVTASPGSAEVGLLGVVPGLEETIRINGRAHVTVDAGVRSRTAIDGRTPKVAVVIDVDECYIHCGQALRRAGLWDQASWPGREDRPSPAAILRDHLSLDVEPAVIAADLETGYRATLWEHGGQ